MLLLEAEDHALARGAPIYAYVSGYATTNDAYHMTAPRPDGQEAARAITLALAEAAIEPEAISYVNAHGSSTVLNDPVECRAIRIALGDHAERVSVSGTKGLHAHALGATGAIELAICVLGLRRGRLPGTVNLATTDPACDLDIIEPAGRKADVEYLVKNSFGFGGINASLVLQNAA